MNEKHKRLQEMYHKIKNDSRFDGTADYCEENAFLWAYRNLQADRTVLLYTHFNPTQDEILENEGNLIKGSASARIHTQIMMCREALNVNLLMVVDASYVPNKKRVLELIEALGVDVAFLISSESQLISPSYEYTFYSGAAGAMTPFVLVKGSDYMPEIPFAGLGTMGMMNEIIKAIELNVEMCDVIDKHMVSPPRFLEQLYSTSQGLPAFGIGTFNWLFLNARLDKRFEQLKTLCSWSIEDAINQYNYSYNEYLRKQGLPSYKCCQQFDVPIFQLSEITPKVPVVLSRVDTVLEAARDLFDHGLEQETAVVIGLLPDFLPESKNEDTQLIDKILEVLQDKGIHSNHEKMMLKSISANVFVESSESLDFARKEMMIENSILEGKGFPIIHLGPGYLNESSIISEDHVKRLLPEILESVICKTL